MAFPTLWPPKSTWRRTIGREAGPTVLKVVTMASPAGSRSRTPGPKRARSLRYPLLVTVLMPFVAATLWYMAATATLGSADGGLGPVIPARHAGVIAVSAITGSQGRSRAWVVTHSDFHPISFIVSDAAGSPRFGSSTVDCPGRVLEQRFQPLGIGCPPPPVWAVQVETSSRKENHKALVEIDALTGEVLGWQVDDTLP